MPPKISLIIPVYNAQPYISRCLESCINQSFKEIEIIIVDDCGSDDSIHIAKEYATKDLRIRIIHNAKNLGTFHTRAQGIKCARGQYCMFVDPDDYLELNACKMAYETISSKQVDMVHFGMSYKPKTWKRIKPIVHRGFLKDKNMRIFLNTQNNCQSLCDKIYKKDILLESIKACDFFTPPLNMLEDGLLVLVASFHSQNYFGLNEHLYCYCHNPKSITKDKSLDRLRQKQYHLDKLLHITSHLYTLYPHYAGIIEKYQHKIASTLLIESRDFSLFELYTSIQILSNHGFKKTYDIPPYLKSTLLSLHYAFRWQNCLRALLFICTFGLWRL